MRAAYDIFRKKNDQSTKFHKMFYKHINCGCSFLNIYQDFVQNFVSTVLNDSKLIYQKTPTFRVHLCGNKAVGEFHKDSDYNHPINEINFFIPMTKAYNTNTIWIETKPGSEEYEPIDLEYGEAFMFNGGIYKHGNKINKTSRTRVGFDFRVINSKEYRPNTKSSLNFKRKFIIGEYYEQL